ncbi:MAG: cytochrome P450, partial [Dehalococcoidia bacterium]|nr:cytochrome P450 [Dehalococcoidia bacterium]
MPFVQEPLPNHSGATSVRTPQPHFDSTIDETWTNPDGILRQLRLHDPVHWSPIEQAWIITSHPHATAILRDDHTFSADARIATGRAGQLVQAVAAQSPLPYDSLISTTDGAAHLHLRRAAAAAFAPTAVDSLRPTIRTLAQHLIDTAPHEPLDAIGQFAQPLSLGVTLHLLGIETPDAPRIHQLANLLIITTQFGLQPGHTAAATAAARDDFAHLIETLEVRESSLLASLRSARDAGRLTTDDLHSLVIFIATVGQAPTVFALGNALLALLRNPDQLTALRDEPALLPNLLDESARFAPPLRVIRRFAAIATQFEGQTIRAGDQLQLIIPATNRDPAVFPNPNHFDIHRGARNHLGFGWASHHCLGAPVARAIAEEAFA